MHKIKQVPLDPRLVKAGPEDGLEEGEFIVYPSTFTRTPDAYGDVVKRGAFARGIKARKEAGVVLSGLYGHRMDDPHLNVAAAIEEAEDEHGWRVRGRFDLDDPTALKVYRLVKGRRLRELSFAYDVLEEGKVKVDVVELTDGTKVDVTANELRDLEVFEFSFVPIGANRDTSVVAIKSGPVVVEVDGVKAGRVLSAKNESALREAYESIGRVLGALEPDEEPKANAPAAPKDEEPLEVKSDEDAVRSSAQARLSLELALGELDLS